MNVGGVPNTCKSSEKVSFGRRVKRRTGELRVRICPLVKDTLEKSRLILHKSLRGERWPLAIAKGWACVLLVCWWGNGSPRRWWLAGLRGWSATLELRHGPDSYGRQQWGILRNGRKPDAATPRGGWRLSGRKLLLSGKKESSLIGMIDDGTTRESTG